MTQLTLPLAGGAHAGPLFVICKQRSPTRPHEKRGLQGHRDNKRATPPWLTPEHMREIARLYAEAQQLTKLTGELHVVDHIVPKISPVVCGLHAPWNLRVIHWRANTEKGNTWWPDMWMMQTEMEV